MRKEKSLAAWHPFSQEIRCHPEPFLCPLQRQATTSIPAGHKKGEGSSRAFTPSKKTSARKDHLLLGIPFSQKNAVILSTFYAHCNAKPQPSFQNTKKNAVILSPFYARCIPKATTSIPAGHKKGEGSSRAFTPSKKPCASNNRLLLGIPFFQKKNPGQLAPTGIYLSPIRGAPTFRGNPNYINATSSVSFSSSPKPSPSPTCSTSHPLFSTKNDPTPSRCTPLHNRLVA